MPTYAILYGTIGLIQPGQGVVVVSSGSYPAVYSALLQQNTAYTAQLDVLANYTVFLGGSS